MVCPFGVCVYGVGVGVLWAFIFRYSQTVQSRDPVLSPASFCHRLADVREWDLVSLNIWNPGGVCWGAVKLQHLSLGYKAVTESSRNSTSCLKHRLQVRTKAIPSSREPPKKERYWRTRLVYFFDELVKDFGLHRFWESPLSELSELLLKWMYPDQAFMLGMSALTLCNFWGLVPAQLICNWLQRV